MTQVIVNYSQQRESEIPLKQLKTGNWYQVTSYEHNSKLIGEIGISFDYYDSAANQFHKKVITPSGHILSHGDLKFREIKNVNISFN
jgi:ssRNA-specific RNase YbeY (16S rRNA maturation enzyme)